MKKFLILLLCSALSLQQCAYATPEQVTTVIVNNNGKTTEHARADRRNAHVFDIIHTVLLGATFCGVSHLTKSVKIGAIVAGLQLYAVANNGHNQDSFICQYGESVGIMTIAFTLGYALRNAMARMR
jgi:hypothetical protein